MFDLEENDDLTSKGMDEVIKALKINETMTEILCPGSTTNDQYDKVDEIVDRNYEKSKGVENITTSSFIKPNPKKEEVKQVTKSKKDLDDWDYDESKDQKKIDEENMKKILLEEAERKKKLEEEEENKKN